MSSYYESMKNGQRNLIELYRDIERSNGVVVIHPLPVDLDSRQAQIRLKDLAWRLNEELMGEVLMAHQDEALGEVIDAVHFYLELVITAGHDHSDPFLNAFTGPPMKFRESVIQASSYLARAMHCLKLRPWRVSHTPTEVTRFFGSLTVCGYSIAAAARALGVKSMEELAALYFQKNEENLRRLQNGY